MDERQEELLSAQLLTQKRLDKALTKMDNLQEEIKSYELALQLIEQELENSEEK